MLYKVVLILSVDLKGAVMTKKLEIYKCGVCGNIVEILFSGVGTLVCCGQDMNLQSEQTSGDMALNHVPVYEKSNDEMLVSVGLMEHPMGEEHYIQMIELIASNKILRKYLEPKEKPEFLVECLTYKDGFARAYCNKHGLWKGASIC